MPVPLRQQAVTLSLRPYQIQALDKIAGSSSRTQLVVMATGTGKTLVAAELIVRREGRSVFLVRYSELISQTVRALLRHGLSDVGVVQGVHNQLGHRHVVATVQSLSQPRRLAHYDRTHLRTVIADECHEARGRSYERVIAHLDAPLTVGLTATPDRSDGRSLLQVFDTISFAYPITSALADGYLVPPRGIRVGTDAMLEQARSGGDLDADLLDAAMVDSNAPSQIARAILRFAVARHTIVYVPRVATAHLVVEECRRLGVTADVVSATVPHARREALYRRHRDGDLAVIANVGVLIAGYDDPRVDCIVPPLTTHPGRYRQAVGRGLRLHPAVSDCLVLDLSGATEMHDLCGMAALAESEEERECLARAVVDPDEATAGAQDPTGAELPALTSYVDLVGNRLHFVADGNRMFLPLAEAGSLMLVPADGELWDVYHRPTSWHAPLELIGEALSIEEAQAMAEDMARRKGAMGVALAGAGWRKRPPTDRQLANLRRKGISSAGVDTAQTASDLLFACYLRRDPRVSG